jgi:hypothetical protein
MIVKGSSMNKSFIMLFCFIGLCKGYGQICIHTDLSPKFSILNRSKRIKVKGQELDSCSIRVQIKDKRSNKILQELSFSSFLFNDDDWANCRSVRSYITGKNVKKEAIDNEYGDIIVADFNFDSREDIALKCDAGGNAGPYYNFYIQKPDGRFYLDPYLTDSMMLFPARFNGVKKTITTLGHSGVGHVGENVYRFDAIENKWLHVSYRRIPT